MSAYELAALGIDLKSRHSGQIKTICPECSHTRKKKLDPCLSVNIDDGAYHCHNCGWAGKATGKRDAYGAAPPKVYTKPDYKAPEKAPNGVVDYLGKRGITPDVIARNHIGMALAWMPQHEGKKPAITFPYYRDGAVVNVKYRTLDKQFRMESGAELTLYGLDDIAADAPLIWCEGEIDKLSLEVAGYRHAVSVPNGAPSPSTRSYARHFEYLNTEDHRLAPLAKHIIAVDADEPGKVLRDELIRRLGPVRCYEVLWPVGCKDANDTLVKHGVDGVRRAIEAARGVGLPGLVEADDIWGDVIDLYEKGLQGGINPGSPALAGYYTVIPGQWTLVTGIPGHGKSALIDWFMVNLAVNHGWRFAVCSPENQPLARHAAQLMQIYVGKPFRKGQQQRMNEEEVWTAHAWLGEHFSFIQPSTESGTTLESILDIADGAARRHGITGLVVDPWNELDHNRQAGTREDEHISVALGKMRQWARDRKVHIWLIAHPTKMHKDKDGIYPVPTPYDVAGGAHFRNKADMAISIYRDTANKQPIAEVHVQKVRFRECGQIGVVRLFHDPLTGRYSDPHRWELTDAAD